MENKVNISHISCSGQIKDSAGYIVRTFAQALKMSQGALVLFPNVRKMFDSNSYNLPG